MGAWESLQRGVVASHPAHAVKPQMPSSSDCRKGRGEELEG